MASSDPLLAAVSCAHVPPRLPVLETCNPLDSEEGALDFEVEATCPPAVVLYAAAAAEAAVE